MPLSIETHTQAVATLDDLIHHCRSAAFDPGSRDSLAAAAPILAALAKNRHFLADLALDALKDACANQSLANGYSPQVMMLAPPDGRFFIRANIWPSATDAMLRDSSPAAYFYQKPHDHAFDFLTVGYVGPGYWSDYYVYDGAVDGVPGEQVDLDFVESSRLEEGKILLYRANHDIHDQHPPDALSISINIMPMTEAQAWRRQYFFDLDSRTIVSCQTITAAELLLPLAVRFGDDNARDLADNFARVHPDPRMRLAAWKALDSIERPPNERATMIERGLGNACPLIRAYAKTAMSPVDNGLDHTVIHPRSLARMPNVA